jgi:hypothetical protein
MEKNDRLLSLDALRGFDMLFIMGLSAFVAQLCAAFGVDDGESGGDCGFRTRPHCLF